MERKRILAWLLACAMLLALLPCTESYAAQPDAGSDDVYHNQEDSRPDDVYSESSGRDYRVLQTAEAARIALAASSGARLPKSTQMVTSYRQLPVTLEDGAVLLITGNFEYKAATGTSPIEIAENANAVIIVNGSITLSGADAVGTTPATAAIHVPESSGLTIYSYSDGDTVQDTLTVTGGSAADGKNGGNAEKKIELKSGYTITTWFNGSGGNGGGGAAAAIGGSGGHGGDGAAREQTTGSDNRPIEIYNTVYGSDRDSSNVDNNSGKPGKSGASGSSGEAAGTVRILGRLGLTATGGSAGSGGMGGNGCGGMANTSGKDHMIGGNGGGGGGGGGCAAPAIGAGGAGGSGGGSGGHLSSDKTDNVQGCGGGGGGGGWPNGGGGGGGGAECTDAESKYDNSSAGGKGGSGGAAGTGGAGGQEGISTGTNDHGINNGKYDAEPGDGGSGAGGIAGSGGAGGSGGDDNHDTPRYNGGDGGSGGGAAARTPWQTAGHLLVSTANRLTLKSDLGYGCGDGQGSGSPQAITPHIVYDLRDCDVRVASAYTYTGEQIRPGIGDLYLYYSVASDRDAQSIREAAGLTGGSSIIRENVSISEYGENIHCAQDPRGNSGSLTVAGTADSKDAAALTDGDVVSSRNIFFHIDQARIGKLNYTIRYSPENDMAYVTLESFRWTPQGGTEKTQTFDTILPRSAQNQGDWSGWPVIEWPIYDQTKYNVSPAADAGTYRFTPRQKQDVTFTPIADLKGMLDFADFRFQPDEEISVVFVKQILPPQTIQSPHPRSTAYVSIPSDLLNYDMEWFLDGALVRSGSGYIGCPLTNADIGKTLSVRVIPRDTSAYKDSGDMTATAIVEDHKYENGFCSVCGEYERPETDSSGAYLIDNGGKLFWFAAWVNGEATHAEGVTERHPAASAVLTADIDLQNPADTASSKITQWTPIAPYTEFQGSFDGQKHTVTGFSITEGTNATGFFARITDGSVIRDVTLKGEISRNAQPFNVTAGSVAAFAAGGTVSGVYADVTISVGYTDAASSSNASYVGGIIGQAYQNPVTVEKCLFLGSVSVTSAKSDAIGGIVGYYRYSDSAAKLTIENCANIGVIQADSGDSTKAGGILGFSGTLDATKALYIRNSYQYGTVQNNGGSSCGAIAGQLRAGAHPEDILPTNITGCYYRTGAVSGDKAFGTITGGTLSTQIVTPKDADAFRSGEVCYLLNGGLTTEDGAVWRQNVDNGGANDGYPVFDGGIVYHYTGRCNCADGVLEEGYSNSQQTSGGHYNHSYADYNGFCSCCGEYEPAAQDADGSYVIDNGGKMFWFAAWVNGEDAHAEGVTEPHPDASARLTTDILLKNTRYSVPTEWTPIGTTTGAGTGAGDIRFCGTFDGGGHTIRGLSITAMAAGQVRTGLFAAIDAGALVKELTVEGRIELSAGNRGDKSGIGGVAGCAYGGEINGVTSRVYLSNTGGELVHAGGVVGGTDTYGVTITRCIYAANIRVTDSYDCIGGVVGYAAKNTNISYCANLGSVTAVQGTAGKAPYTGGILGYLNTATSSVRNCYNYGTVDNGCETNCGGIIGLLKYREPKNLTDNYYLDTSASAGSGGNATAVAKTQAAFESGEVCYLVNGGVSRGSGAVWRQNVDNGGTNDGYPVFDAAVVYRHSDGVYSNEEERVSVTISWNSMTFAYTAPEDWDPASHTYPNAGWAPASQDADRLTVTNNSNVTLDASLTFTPEGGSYGLLGYFRKDGSGDALEGTQRLPKQGGGDNVLSARLILKSGLPDVLIGETGEARLGVITVRLATLDGQSGD